MNGELEDPNDPGVPGIRVELWTDPDGNGDPSDGVKISMTVTDADGKYIFTSVPPGDYVIIEVDFPTYDSTADAAGANDNRIPITMPPSGDLTARDFLDSGHELCNDGIDNDFNGDTDCEDAFRKDLPLCSPTAPMLSPQLMAVVLAVLSIVAAWGLRRVEPASGKLR